MSDESVIVRKQGTIFLGGPPLVKAATGEVVSAEDLGGADVHCRTSGVTDHYAMNDAHALASPGASSANLNAVKRPRLRSARRLEPLLRPGGAPRRGPGRHPQALRRARGDRPHRGRLRASTSSSSSTAPRWSAASPASTATRWGSSPTTASSSPSPRSRGPTSSSSAPSAASRWFSCRTSPASWWARKYEAGGIAKDGAKMVTAVACARVPKFTVLIGGSFGAGNYGMCGRAYSPRFLWMWPNARISVMGGEQAASVLAQVKRDGMEARGETWQRAEEEAFKSPIREQYEAPGPPLLRQRPALGRRDHRSGGHPDGAWPGDIGRAQRAARENRLRRFPDVTTWTKTALLSTIDDLGRGDRSP